ncbi:MAG: 16S rRNA (uracil(1498)-N(3))-methyltransferase [Eubacteriales bacterium]
MPRFFVAPEILDQSTVELTGAHAVHGKVLRLQIGDHVTLCDGDGTDGDGVITQISSDAIYVDLLSTAPAQSEPSHRVTVFMAYAKGDKLEHVIQKATELGAWEIVAFPASRCVAKVDGKSLSKKLERWQKIAVSAGEQAGRGRIPQVRAASSFAQAVAWMQTMDLPILLYENEDQFSLRQALSGFQGESVALMSGPEGGFDPSEIQVALDAGISICTLGTRILRCETAPLCALSATMFATGELG